MVMISGWGRYNNCNVEVLKSKNINLIKNKIKQSPNNTFICRGLGRSYGDSSINDKIFDLSNLQKKFQLFEKKKEIKCTSNFSIKELLSILLKKNFFLKVTPGSQYVTIGGAIASDVHGKNHHIDGSFCDYVNEIEVLLANGKIIKCSKTINKKLFISTCGGMGLTGIILSAKIQLLKIPSNFIKETIVKSNSLKETMNYFKNFNHKKYIVSWIDSSAKKHKLGRGLIYIGEHIKQPNKNFSKYRSFNLPFEFPNFFLNNFFLKILNKIFFLKNLKFKKRIVEIKKYFYPLDNINNWNKIYGKSGFVQIQILISDNNLIKNLLKILLFFQKKNQVSFVTTLKKLGKKNENLLSFPDEGYTITFDIKNNKNLKTFYSGLEKILIKMNAKIYLTKDTLMSKNYFEKTYSNKNKFIKYKKIYDPKCKFSSYQSSRLGITQ
jgi:decaprenylphospho-beta-D-ribofuranose 2-oxidase